MNGKILITARQKNTIFKRMVIKIIAGFWRTIEPKTNESLGLLRANNG